MTTMRMTTMMTTVKLMMVTVMMMEVMLIRTSTNANRGCQNYHWRVRPSWTEQCHCQRQGEKGGRSKDFTIKPILIAWSFCPVVVIFFGQMRLDKLCPLGAELQFVESIHLFCQIPTWAPAPDWKGIADYIGPTSESKCQIVSAALTKAIFQNFCLQRSCHAN